MTRYSVLIRIQSNNNSILEKKTSTSMRILDKNQMRLKPLLLYKYMNDIKVCDQFCAIFLFAVHLTKFRN